MTAPKVLRPEPGCLSLTRCRSRDSALLLLLAAEASLPAVGSTLTCCVLQAVDRCLHFSNLQDTNAGAWAWEASSEADSSSAAGDYLSVSAASQGAAGWPQAGPELWPLDDSEKLRVRFRMLC